MQSLPSHRQVLTALIDAISAACTVNEQESDAATQPTDRRRLFLTLHVLFPNLLLPALDLVDRKLVTLVTLHSAAEDEPPCSIILVKSAVAKPIRRGRPPEPPRNYVVRLSAWSCNCASFSVDAFLPTSGERSTFAGGEVHDHSGGLFGGLSSDGSAVPGHVPCCKHLLAAVLASQWGHLLGGYMERRFVTKEELAGLLARI
ncbi:unnamed protein product [Clonostachys rhizophaga]|uniref:SWIM-type domain-containing protein n=1 Tax=Clonostachys rhizophaga TaxID=160324 RepID=A0A9N9YKF2_9HYPO|nr:unnamed protein product [Clonostachys rhizophaga]